MGGMYDLDLQHDLPGVPGVVFDHFTRIELLTTWWPSSGETDPRPGGTYRLFWDGPDVTLRGVYDVVERPSALRLSWSWDHEAVTSDVEIGLAPSPSGTRVRIRQTAATAAECDGYREGWTFFLGRLAAVLDG